MPEVRRGRREDLEAVAAIQAASPEAAQWPVADYLDHEFHVALTDGRVAGFLAGRSVGDGERELLNLAVQPELRRKGVARALFGAWISDFQGVVWLEVREGNSRALHLYQSLGFKEVSRRNNYYKTPDEAAIVLKFHSC